MQILQNHLQSCVTEKQEMETLAMSVRKIADMSQEDYICVGRNRSNSSLSSGHLCIGKLITTQHFLNIVQSAPFCNFT